MKAQLFLESVSGISLDKLTASFPEGGGGRNKEYLRFLTDPARTTPDTASNVFLQSPTWDFNSEVFNDEDINY